MQISTFGRRAAGGWRLHIAVGQSEPRVQRGVGVRLARFVFGFVGVLQTCFLFHKFLGMLVTPPPTPLGLFESPLLVKLTWLAGFGWTGRGG